MCDAQGRLIYNFYIKSCPGVEDLVRQVVNKYIAADHTIAASLLRLHFPQLFCERLRCVIALEFYTKQQNRKDAISNLTVRGFEVIDNVKAQIINVREWSHVLTLSLWQLAMLFLRSFSDRLYSFGGSGGMDPTLEYLYAQLLKMQCKNLTDNTTKVEMDPDSSLAFDNHYFGNLQLNRGLLQSDAALLSNFVSKANVDNLRNQKEFFENFKFSMQRVGEIELLTGSAGEIWKKCAFVN
eukprot:PITA_15135